MISRGRRKGDGAWWGHLREYLCVFAQTQAGKCHPDMHVLYFSLHWRKKKPAWFSWEQQLSVKEEQQSFRIFLSFLEKGIMVIKHVWEKSRDRRPSLPHPWLPEEFFCFLPNSLPNFWLFYGQIWILASQISWMQGLVHPLTPTVPGTNYYDNEDEDEDEGDHYHPDRHLESWETDHMPGSM